MLNSGTKYEIRRDPTPAQVREVADFMREADRAEVRAMADMDPHQALLASLAASELRNAVGLVDGRPICMFGVGTPTLLSDSGAPWLLGTKELEDHAIPFFRHSREWVAETKQQFSLLANYVSAENTKSVKWLRWLGFTVAPDIAIFGGTTFHPFAWRR